MDIEDIFTIFIYKMVEEWNSQLTTSSWCQRERWHHLPYVTHIATLQARH